MPAQLFRRVVTLIVAMIGLGVLSAPAAAQFGPSGPMRVGFILPQPPSADAPDWQKEFYNQLQHGAIWGQEISQFNAELMGLDFDVLYENASGTAAVTAAADRLLAQGVYAVIGGTTVNEALALSQWGQAHGVPYFNIAVQSDLLRNDMCASTTFHIEASAAMYLDALAGWYVRDGFRSWYVIRDGNDEGQRLYNRLDWAINNRHFGVQEVGNAVLSPDMDAAAIMAAYNSSHADLLVLLVDPAEQIKLYGDLEAAGFRGEVAGYPYPAAQTRAFYAALGEVAPDIDIYRAELWEPTLDTSGAIEFNAAFSNRWDGEPMDGPASAAFHAIKISGRCRYVRRFD